MKSLKNAPTSATNGTDKQAFRVWANNPAYAEDPRPWHCVASFRFLGESLDYVAYSQDMGATVVLQSPTGCKAYTPTDRRAVFKSPLERNAGKLLAACKDAVGVIGLAIHPDDRLKIVAGIWAAIEAAEPREDPRENSAA